MRREDYQNMDMVERLIYGPKHWANLGMAAANILVFAVTAYFGLDTARMLEYGAAFTPYILEGEYYRLFTSMFLHFNLQHLVSNMIMLVFLGDYLEAAVGKIRFLIIYLAGGIAGNLLSIAYELYTQEFAVSAGASGAIFSVTGALIYLVLRKKDRVPGLSGQRLILMAVLTILQGMTAIGIDNEAHIGGLAAGFLLGWLLTLRM